MLIVVGFSQSFEPFKASPRKRLAALALCVGPNLSTARCRHLHFSRNFT